jgi:hypothetical protein
MPIISITIPVPVSPAAVLTVSLLCWIVLTRTCYCYQPALQEVFKQAVWIMSTHPQTGVGVGFRLGWVRNVIITCCAGHCSWAASYHTPSKHWTPLIEPHILQCKCDLFIYSVKGHCHFALLSLITTADARCDTLKLLLTPPPPPPPPLPPPLQVAFPWPIYCHL